MRNGDGKFELTPALLGTIIAACLAVGSGGAFYASRGGATSAGQAASISQTSQIDVRVAILEERARVAAESTAEIKQTLHEIQLGVAALEKKIDLRNGRTAPAPAPR
jgi:hypothetical protein